MIPNAKTWTTANFVSSSRLFLLAPLAYCLFSEFENNRLWAAGIVALGAVTDFVDGFVARRMHAVSELGKVIDPLADKVAVGALAIFLVILGDIPLWYAAMVLARDLLIVGGGLLIRARKGIVVQSNWPGKIAVSLTALYLLFALLRIEAMAGVQNAVLWTSIAFMILSLVMYGQRLFIGRAVEGGRKAE